MQRSGAILILRMDVGAFVEEATDGLYLPFGIPRGTADETVGCIVQRAAAAVIRCRVWVGAHCQEKPDNILMPRSRRRL